MQIRQRIFNRTDMQITHFIIDEILKLLTYYMPFCRRLLQSYVMSETVRFWPTLYIRCPVSEKTEDMFTHFDKMHERDRQTDGQTDTHDGIGGSYA